MIINSLFNIRAEKSKQNNAKALIFLEKKRRKVWQYRKYIVPLHSQFGNELIIKEKQRGVAQLGSASGLGPGGRRFESCRPDFCLTL